MNTWVHPWFLVGSLLLIFLVFCVVFWSLCVFILCFVYPIMAMLPVSLDCPFLIAPSNVYLYIAVVSYFVGGVHHYKLIILFCDKKNPDSNTKLSETDVIKMLQFFIDNKFFKLVGVFFKTVFILMGTNCS